MNATAPKGALRHPCPECGRRFETVKGLGKHRNSAHGILGPKSSNRRPPPDPRRSAAKKLARLARMREADLNPAGYVCKSCGKKFKEPEDLGRHMGVRD